MQSQSEWNTLSKAGAMRVWRVRAEQPEQGGGVCVGRDVPEQSMRCWPRQKAAAALPLPLLRHATTIAVDGAPAAAAIAAASWSCGGCCRRLRCRLCDHCCL